jgi:photosystem II stability/assembly factor-like uncharacterized protein
MKSKITISSLLVLFLFNYAALSQATCTEQVSGVTTTLTSVFAMTSQQLWVCGYNATVLRTTNGGTNWINVSGNGIPMTRLLVNVAGISTTTAIVSGYEGTTTYVYHTSNSGANWTQVFMQANGGFINSVNMRSGSAGFMQGDPVGGRWSLWKTTNGGLNWDSTGLYLPQAGAEAGWNNSMVTHNGGTPGPFMWFGTNNSRIYYSTNGGVSWNVQSTAPEVNAYSVYFPYNPTSEGLSGGATLIRTSNLGSSWSAAASTGTGNINGITGTNLVTDNTVLPYTWYIRSNNNIYYSGNNGSSWVINYTAPAGNYRHITLTDFSSIGTWYAVRDNGGITKGTYSISSVNPVLSEIPGEFSLMQNYPNPFNPSTTFKFSIPEKSFVTLKVYNSIGVEIETIVKGELSPSTYEAKWEASKYSSGVYFYSLQTIGFSETKKMILIK